MQKPQTKVRRVLNFLDRIHADSLALGGLLTGVIVLALAVTLGERGCRLTAKEPSRCYACEHKDKTIFDLQRELSAYELANNPSRGPDLRPQLDP